MANYHDESTFPMRYRLRTLLIVVALGPVVLAGAWLKYSAWRAEQAKKFRPYIDPYSEPNLAVEGRDFDYYSPEAADHKVSPDEN